MRIEQRVVAVLFAALSLFAMTSTAARAATVSGEAFGASVDVPGVVVAKIPQVVLPSAGGSASQTILGVTAPPALTTGTLSVSTSGTATATTASAQSSSTVQSVSALGGLVTADVLTAETSCTCGGGAATCSPAGSQLLNVVVDGVPIMGTPPRNTMITIPGIAVVTLNEQVSGGDGIDTAELTVNMIHIQLLAPVAGDIIVSSAHSDVSCVAGPTPTPTATAGSTACVPQPTPTATPIPTTPLVSGEGFGASATLGPVTIGPVSFVMLSPTGGSSSASVLGISEPGTLETGTLTSTTSGTTTATTANSSTTTTVQDVNVVGGLVTATLVQTQSSSTCDGSTASSTGSATFTDLVVDGLVLGNVTPAPNTTVLLPGGIGSVTLNEQIAGGDGVNSSELTVNAVHIRLTAGPLIGDVIIASAHSDVDCAPAAPPPLPPSSSVSGEAFGTSVQLLSATLGPVPQAVLPATGGSLQATVLGVGVPGVLTAGTMTVMTSGTPGAGTANAQSSSTVQTLDVAGVITADLITAQTSCTCGGGTATCTDAGSGFVNLVVAGIPIAINPPPNTTIPLPGIGSVILNEQSGSNGVDSADLTVNMVHVIFDPMVGPLSGDVIVASAHSDVNCAQGPVATPTATGTAAPTPTCTVAPTGTGSTPTPTPSPTPELNHFQCYEVHRGPFETRTVALEDVYGPSTVQVRPGKRLCNPADKRDEDPTAPSDPDHLAGYKIRQVTPRFTTQRGRLIVNQFGTLAVDIAKPEFLYVPSAKNLTAPPPPVPTDPAVDHFKCYRVRRGKFRTTNLKVDDQFGTIFVDIKKPVRLCLAANKNMEGFVEPTAALFCYQVKLTTGTTSQASPPSVAVANQFESDVFEIFRPTELCVPSTLLPP